MTRWTTSMLVLVCVAASGCGQRDNTLTAGTPVAPSSTNVSMAREGRTNSFAVPANRSQATSSDATPFHILHPVRFAMIQGNIVFPPRNEPNDFFSDLQTVYRDTLRRTQSAPSYVDPEGENVWLTEYFRFYLNGCSHQDAMNLTITEIVTGNSLPTCGGGTLAFPPRNLPFEFQAQLENVYRNTLKRPLMLSYVDAEGANVWLAEYLRYRVAGSCDHASAESRVFTQIAGGGVQPVCSGSQQLRAILVSCSPASISNAQGSSQCTASAQYSDGSTQPLKGGVAWETSDPAEASISSTGVLTAGPCYHGSESVTVTATSSGVSGATSFRFSDFLGSGGPSGLLSVTLDLVSCASHTGSTFELSIDGSPKTVLFLAPSRNTSNQCVTVGTHTVGVLNTTLVNVPVNVPNSGASVTALCQ